MGKLERVAVVAAAAVAIAAGAWSAEPAGAGGPAGAAKGKKGKKGKKNPLRVRTFQNAQQLLIADDPPGASFPGMLDATIRVGKKLKGLEVADADVGIRITHPDPDDLDVFLIAPNGATVGLAFDNAGQAGNTSYGSGAADCSGAQTTFSDETFNFISNAATINEPGEILSPWAATVEPQGLPAPLNIVDGGRLKGVWTLRVLDDSNGDIGTLHCWKLRLKPRRP